MASILGHPAVHFGAARFGRYRLSRRAGAERAPPMSRPNRIAAGIDLRSDQADVTRSDADSSANWKRKLRYRGR